MRLSTLFHFDAFFALVLSIAVLEGIRAARNQVTLRRASWARAIQAGTLETLLLALCAATTSPLAFVAIGGLRLALSRWRDGRIWWRGALSLVLIGAAMATMTLAFGVESFEEVSARALDIGSTWRVVILALVSSACVLAIVPARISDEAKATLAAPYVLVAFARIGVPLDAQEPRLALAAPIIGALVGALSALWLLSAGMRANHFERSALVSELVTCERGVLLSFVWIGLASGERLAGVGAFLEWWASSLALLALEASLRVRPLPKPMAFFALAMAVGLPGTTGFIADDLLAHGLVELRPLLAAAIVCVGAINAAALYLALVNLIADGGHGERGDSRPTAMMIAPAVITLVFGLVPGPFVAAATAAREAIAPQEAALAAHGAADDGDSNQRPGAE